MYLVGQKFGRWTVIKQAKNNGYTKYWKCICNCGTSKPRNVAQRNMHQRCYNKNYPGYKNLGGRGIKVCWRWHSDNPKGFENFIKDMGPRPPGKYKNGRSKYSLERKNNNKDYKPSNCIWATAKEQRNNQRAKNLWE